MPKIIARLDLCPVIVYNNVSMQAHIEIRPAAFDRAKEGFICFLTGSSPRYDLLAREWEDIVHECSACWA